MKPNEDIIVKVDPREPSNTLEKIRKFFPNAIQEQLAVFDIIYKNLGFELKTLSDFIQSIMDGRFRNQLYNIKMNENFISYYIIYGHWADINKFSHIKITAVLGAIASIIARYGINVIIMPNKDYAIYTISRIIEKSFDKRDIKPVTYKKTTEDRAINMLLSSTERFQEKSAKEALEHFGTVKNVINSDLKSLEKIKGIGLKIAHGFFETINYDFKQKKDFLEDFDIDFDIERDKIKTEEKITTPEKELITNKRRNELVYETIKTHVDKKKEEISLSQLKTELKEISDLGLKEALQDLQLESLIYESDHEKYNYF